MKLSWNRTSLIGRELSAGVLGLAALAVGTVLLVLPVLADDAAESVSAARLSSVDGQVQISQGSQVLADQAVANTPLFEGTRVVTGDNGRAEIQLEDGSVARLSPNSSLTLKALQGQGGAGDAEIVLESGLGYFELQGAGQTGTVRIRFGDAVVTAGGFSVLRINLDNPPGELAVFSGNAHLENGNAAAADLHGGESVALSGADAANYVINESIEPDSWDSWNSDRDQVLSAEASSKTPATTGFADSNNPAWNDLDANGNWYNVPGQGNIWSPYDASDPGWDPYGNGDWMAGPQGGYFWVSGYPWGYLPYQCGNWNYYDAFGWGWAPGQGGCSPWWGRGFFRPNIGIGFGGYRPPLPPHPRPRPPIGHGEMAGPYPMIAVNRRTSGVSGALPVRNAGTPVVIAGHSVQAFRPLTPRPQYDHSASVFVNRTPYQGTRTVGGQGAAIEPGAGGGRPAYSPRAYSPNSTAARTPSTGSFSQPAPAPRSAPSGGYSGGGGSAGHSSGGGYSGGGGGASHPSGGGGGGGSHR